MNLLDVVSGFFTPDVVSKMASGAALSDESPVNVRKAINAAVPAVFAGLGQASSSPSGAERIFGVAGEPNHAGLLGRLSGMTSRQLSDVAAEGQTLLTRMVGDHGATLTDLVARSSGVRATSADHIMGLVTAVAGGVLYREVASRDLGATGLADLLSSQKKAIADNPYTPVGLTSMLGASTSEIGTAGARDTDKDAVRELREPKKGEPPRRSRWLPTALLAALAIVGIWAVVRSRRSDVAVVPPVPPPPEAVPEIVERLRTTSEDFKLPDGKILHLESTSGEADLARYLSSGARDLPRRFALGGLNFELDAIRLTPAAMGRVDSVAEILKAYPSARVRIEGHTDASGNPTTNHALSVARAEEMRRMLTARGVAPERIETQGKGESQPIAPNDTPEGRAQNRRIEIVVVER